MWWNSALQGDSEVAAFESYLESNGFSDDDAPAEGSPETPKDDDRSPEDQANADAEEEEEDLGDHPLDPETEKDPDEELEASGEDEDKGEGEGEDEDISTIAALAEFFELPEADVLQNLEVEAPGGDMVSIGEALDGWRESERMFEARSTTLEAEHRDLVTVTQETSNKHLQQIATLTQGLIARMTEEFSSDRLAAARMENPEAYADLIDAKTKTEKLVSDSIAAMDAEADRRQEHSNEDIQKIMVKQNELLLKAKPEWQDNDIRRKALSAGNRYLLSTGWTQQDIDSIMDHRLLLLVDDAVAGRRVRKGSDGKTVKNLRKRGLKKPNTGLKARSRRDPENPKNRARQTAYARLKKTGDAKDAVDLFMDVL
jgi:hypothetical protein